MWYLALVMVISVSFSFVLYRVASGELTVGLEHQSARISSQFPVFENDPILHPTTDIDDGEHSLLARLIVFNVVVLFASGFASYWLARRTLQPIEEAHEQQKRFTADVSHELRTPLTALRMESEVALMNNQTTKDELRGTIESNLEEAGKLEALINNLLRLTRLEADEMKQNFVLQSAESLITTAIEQLQAAATAQDITVTNTKSTLPVFGDTDSIIQLLVILLDNAIKYSPRGSGVEISCRSEDKHTLIVIRDHGKGIEQSALEHVFDRFYRADSSRVKTSKTDGYGLGLSIAKMIADVHDGTITLSSKVGHGTTATVALPQSSET
jgi:signal transduction histidine kinase